MPDYDVIIIGGGPAGLCAGLYLTRARYHTLVIEKESLGGQLTKIDLLENYPGFSKGIAGPQLASEMLAQAASFGLQIELGEVTGIERYSKTRCVQLANGRTITAKAIIIASGCRRTKLGVPGEKELQGNGVIGCALCDGEQLTEKTVAVCGGGDTGLTEAIYMTKLASKVILLEAAKILTASPILQERARNNSNLEIRCGTKIVAILGNTHVEAVELEDLSTSKKRVLRVDGVLIDIGMTPNTDFLNKLVPLDTQGRIKVNERMETAISYVYAVGDVRSGSSGQVATGVGDGVVAAISVQKLLQQE